MIFRRGNELAAFVLDCHLNERMFSHKTSCVYTACDRATKSSWIFDFGNKSAFKIICSKKSMDNLLLDAIIGLNSKISQFALLSLDITNS